MSVKILSSCLLVSIRNIFKPLDGKSMRLTVHSIHCHCHEHVGATFGGFIANIILP